MNKNLKYKNSTKSFDICGMISAGKTSVLCELEKFLNTDNDLTKYPKLLPYANKFKVFYEKPDPKVLKRYYRVFETKLSKLYLPSGIILFALVLFYLVLNSNFNFVSIIVIINLFIASFNFFFNLFCWIVNKLILKYVCFDTQIHFLSKRLSILSKKIEYKGLIANDRSWLEDKLFPQMQFNDKLLTKLQFEIYNTFYKEYSKFMPIPDFFIYLDTTPEIAFSNLQKRISKKRLNKDDITGEELITLSYLKKLGQVYDNWRDEMKLKFGDKFIIVDYKKYQPLKKMLEIINKNL